MKTIGQIHAIFRFFVSKCIPLKPGSVKFFKESLFLFENSFFKLLCIKAYLYSGIGFVLILENFKILFLLLVGAICNWHILFISIKTDLRPLRKRNLLAKIRKNDRKRFIISKASGGRGRGTGRGRDIGR